MTRPLQQPASYLAGAPSLPGDLLVALDAGGPLGDSVRRRLRREIRKIKRDIRQRREAWKSSGGFVRVEPAYGSDPDLFEPWGEPPLDW